MTSSERSEVAERMRVYSHDFDFGNTSPFWYVAKSVFGDVNRCTYGSAFSRLSDLIDPTCHKVIPSEMEGYVFCSNCGAEIGEYGVPNYCHNCGCRVVD